jgi:hypothetical protein
MATKKKAAKKKVITISDKTHTVKHKGKTTVITPKLSRNSTLVGDIDEKMIGSSDGIAVDCVHD